MVDLVATEAIEGLPKRIGDVEISLAGHTPMHAIAPFRGREDAAAQVLGRALPKVGRSAAKGGVEICWFSKGQWMMIGAAPEADLGEQAAVTDQSDAWCVLQVTGAKAEAVLARLVPVDLRRAAFKRGHCLRSQLNHMSVHITRTGPDAFRIMGFRSMAQTMVTELSHAMQAVAARG